jgi:hypothetical protein
MKGASHHAWTHPARAGDQKSVVDAREAIAARVDAWLREGPMDEEEEEGEEDAARGAREEREETFVS